MISLAPDTGMLHLYRHKQGSQAQDMDFGGYLASEFGKSLGLVNAHMNDSLFWILRTCSLLTRATLSGTFLCSTEPAGGQFCGNPAFLASNIFLGGRLQIHMYK
jgi:hypothetical protein